jgi:hypothetical protein
MTDPFFYTYYQHLEALERKIKASPINLGGILASGGGTGGPPGGFLGMLPQTRVAYDLSEASLSGFVSGSPYDPSGVLISASLLDNMNHIRYRITALEIGGSGSGVHIYNNDTLIATGIHILDFKGDFVDAVDVGGNEVEITVSGKKEFVHLDDTPSTYTSHANKYVTVNNAETLLEFSTVVFSGGTDWKVKVSANDTTQGFLEDKVVAGSGIQVSTLNDGSNEDLQVAIGSHTHVEADVLDLTHDADLIKGVTVSALAPTTDDVLAYDGSKWTPTPLPAGADAVRVIGFYQEFTSGWQMLASGGAAIPVRMLTPWAGTISNVVASVVNAPTVSGVIVDIHKNGTTVFTTQGNRPNIAVGTLDDLTSTPDVTAFAMNDVFTCHIDQVGQTGGEGLLVQVRVTL